MTKNKIPQVFHGLPRVLLLGGILFLWIQGLYGANAGCKFIKNYSYRDYRGTPENWKIAQDARGIIYVCNSAGLLEFDGVSWKRIRIPHVLALTLDMDENGTIYIGGYNEIGFLKPDSKGTLRYVSLKHHLKDNQKEFTYVWYTLWVKDRVYFKSPEFLFHWDKKKIKVWQSEYPFFSTFYPTFSCSGNLFIQNGGTGLMQMVNGSLKLVPGGQTFAGNDICMMVPYDDKRILIGTSDEGFYLYDGIHVVPFSTEADEYLRKNQLYHGIRLMSSAGEFALATRLGGLVIIDANGRLKYIFNKTLGLQSDNVNYVFEDASGNLWLALIKGISKIEYSSPFTIYDERANLSGLVVSALKHRNVLYVGTTNGLFFLSTSLPGQFHPVPGIYFRCWSLLPIGDSVLAATNDGLYLVQKDSARKLMADSCLALHRSRKDNRRIWLGTHKKLVSLYMNEKKGQLAVEKKFENITIDIGTIVEDQQGDLWLGTLSNGVIKVDFPGVIDSPVVARYDTSHGLPKGAINAAAAAGHVMFATHRGIFRFDEVHNGFIPDRTLGSQFAGGSSNVPWIVEDKNKHIWFHTTNRCYQAIPQRDGSFVIYPNPLSSIANVSVSSIYPDPDEETVWFCGVDGLIRYDKTKKENYDVDFPVLIRKIRSMDGKFLVFGGYKTNTPDAYPSFPALDYKNRNLRIDFAAPFFEDESRMVYRYFLDGRDKEWSAWTLKNYVDYPDLAPGSYTFRVRAKNAYGHLSRADVFQFKVLPPWYRSWWAYPGYVLAFFLVIYLAVKWRSRKLEQEKQRLEQIVKDRTREIKDKNLQLENQTLQLKEQSEQLQEMDRVKSRFFANISHEFRTPLTLIMGPLEQMLSDSNESELKQKARLMFRNSQQLLNLVNQLLELARFDSGTMKLKASCQDMVPFLRSIAASFESLAVQNRLELTFHAEEESIPVYFEPEKLERIIGNLVANAIKFTPAGGRIKVSVKRNPGKDANFPSGSLDISVSDTGIGILESQLEKIFERFYQANGSYEHKQKGCGIGLALTKELVNLHHGEIHVRSRIGSEGKASGTEFIVRLPLGKEHLQPEEVQESLFETPAIDGFEYTAADAELGEVKDTLMETPDSQQKGVILVVEDNADMRTYIRRAVGPLYRVIEAADGSEGIKKARKIIPDLIISDIMMPGVDGYELCSVLRKDINTSHIPIILLTAKASEESVIQGLEIGADDYITKPFSAKILTVRIKNLIDLRRQLQFKRRRQMMLQPLETSVTSIDETFYKELQDIIEKNLSDPAFNVEHLHQKLYMSRTSLYKKILALTGETPSQFIRSYRLKRAAQLLRANFGNVTEVAFAVGFSNTAYFAKCFKEQFHRLPSSYMTSEIIEPLRRHDM